METRRIVYYLPFVKTKEVVRFSGFELKPFSEESKYSDLLIRDIFSPDGSVLEVGGFVSGGLFTKEVDRKTCEMLEVLKFGYFFLNPSYSGAIEGYVSSQTFEMFRLLEKSPDSAWEHKVILSNGILNYQYSLETYYKERAVLTKQAVSVDAKALGYVDVFSSFVEEESSMSAMVMYNKCWNTYSIHSHHDRTLLARVSIEHILKNSDLNLKSFIDAFIEKAFVLADEGVEENPALAELKVELEINKDEIRGFVTDRMLELKEIRDGIAHEGIQDIYNYSIPFYLLWFPLFWLVVIQPGKVTEDVRVRVILFLCLLRFKPEDWQRLEIGEIPNRQPRAHLDTYVHHSRVLPIYLRGENKKTIFFTLYGLVKWVKGSGGGEPRKSILKDIRVKNPERMIEYRSQLSSALALFGAELAFCDDEVIFIHFPNSEAAAQWCESEEYHALIPLRTLAIEICSCGAF